MSVDKLDVSGIPYLDTSALAKWYIHEDFSDEVECFLQSLSYAYISSLTRIEFRCLLARRRRSQEMTSQLEADIFARLQQDIRQGHLRVLKISDGDLETAMEIMNELADQPLRTLDAFHLAITRSADIQFLATADRTMAACGKELGMTVEEFFPTPE